MAQAAFPFDTRISTPGQFAQRSARAPQAGGTAEPGTLEHTGFELGWDHAHHGLTPPLAHLHADSPVRQGWQAGRAAFGSRTLKASPAVLQWLALRLQAWREGQVFEGVQVTPRFLARLATPHCPVSRLPLGQQADDAVVMRLNLQAAYAAGNLVLVHRSVAEARAALGLDELQALAQRLQADATADTASGTATPATPAADSPETAVRGLSAAQWQRLAVLVSFATPLPAARAACLPLSLLPGHSLRVINPVQALQLMLTLQFSAAGYARRLLGLAALMPGHELRQAFQIFMHTMLARRLAVGVHADATTLRRAAEDSWADPLVQRRWQRLAMRLTAADCEQLLQRAAQRGLVVGGGRWISAESATEGWALPATPAGRAAAQPSAMPSLWARPGSARSLGSQKLAS